jgi:hypothetical protein
MADRLAALEKELMGQVIDNQQRTQTGKTEQDGTRAGAQLRAEAKAFGIRQGFRRRDGNKVLENFQTIRSTTTHSGAMWEDALNFERDTLPMPDYAKDRGDTGQMANQMGLVETAAANFTNSKNKLSQLHLVGS